MSKNMNILDSAGTAFFERELMAVKAQTYDVQYPQLTYDKVFPVSTDTNPGATSITFHTYDRKGMAKVISSNAKDIPRVDVDGEETTIPVRTLASAFGYTVMEINSSMMVGKGLDRRRADAARMANEEKMNAIAWNGDTASGLIGVMSHPNIPRGNSLYSNWTTRTPVQIRDAITAAFNAVFSATKGVERPDTLALPPSQWAHIMGTALSDDNSMTIANWIASNSPFLRGIQNIVMVPELEGAGTNGVDVALIYTNRADKLVIEIPQDIMFHEPQLKGLEYETIVTSTFAGLNLFYPLSMYIVEDI